MMEVYDCRIYCASTPSGCTVAACAGWRLHTRKWPCDRGRPVRPFLPGSRPPSLPPHHVFFIILLLVRPRPSSSSSSYSPLLFSPPSSPPSSPSLLPSPIYPHQHCIRSTLRLTLHRHGLPCVVWLRHRQEFLASAVGLPPRQRPGRLLCGATNTHAGCSVHCPSLHAHKCKPLSFRSVKTAPATADHHEL